MESNEKRKQSTEVGALKRRSKESRRDQINVGEIWGAVKVSEMKTEIKKRYLMWSREC